MAWFLNTMGPDSLINMWSLTILNFFFSLIVNVEISARLETVKYLSKYIYKGPDRATMEISSGMQNEIKAHLDSCFIGPMEACWKIFEFNIHGESLAVQHLPIYLPNEHYVNFYAHQTINKVLAKQNMEKTQLTAWFDYNSVHDDGLGLTYWQFPQYYTWNAKVKSWHPRQRAKVIGRIYFVSPSKREQFFLWLLLTIFESRKSWEHLRTWNSMSSVVSSHFTDWWSSWASSTLGSIQGWTMW